MLRVSSRSCDIQGRVVGGDVRIIASKDENLRLQNLWAAIEIYAAILTNL
jgi:hypothetical protein